MTERKAWFVLINENELGPLGLAELAHMAERKEISSRTLAWSEGMAEWTPAGKLPGLSLLFPVADIPTGMGRAEPGFFGSLFDLSFTTLITPKIISLIFRVLLALGALATVLFLFGVIATMAAGAGGRTSSLTLLLGVASPLLFLVFAVLARVWCEMLIVVFKIADHASEIAQQGRQKP